MTYDMSIHTNPDAYAWAQFYCKTIKENPATVVDEALMTAWFANAMMAMHDHLVLNGNPLNGDHAEYLMKTL